MYCNSCMKQIPKDEITYCKQCSVPLCKRCANHCLVCNKELCDTCYEENQFRCEECYDPGEMFKIIRRSHIEQYAGCPYSLYLQLVLGITPPMGSHAQLGVIVHELIDQISKGELDLQTAKVSLENRVVDWNLSVKEENTEYSVIPFEFLDTGNTCLENFMLIKDLLGKDFKSEYKIEFSLGEDIPNISCTLDRIEFKEDGSIHIHDWKTGKPMSGQKLITDLQPPLYMYAVCKEFGKMPTTFTLHYLNPNKHITYTQIEDMKYEVKTSRNTYVLDVEEALQRTREILDGINKKKFNMPSETTGGWRCNKMCWFGMSGKCQGTVKETWKNLKEKYNKEEV